MRTCRICGETKETYEFDKGRYKCKECRRKSLRTGIPNTGRFQKGQKPKCPLKKGNIPWNKGITYSEEYRKKLSCARTGVKLSEAHRESLKKALQARWDKIPSAPTRQGKKYQKFRKDI